MDGSSRNTDDLNNSSNQDEWGRDDCFAPPAEPCECYCLHCQRTFMSDRMWFQRIIGAKHMKGFWMCPTPNCDGAGFTFDIYPTDPAHPANEGWEEDECDEFWDDDEFLDENDGEYDPDESKYKALDEAYGDVDDDIEGEEWKYGLQPGEQREQMVSLNDVSGEWVEEQIKYDEPDERPRVLDWTGREEQESQFSEDDIPF